MKKIFLLTNSKYIIPQRRYERESLNLDVMREVFLKNGFFVESLTFHEFVNSSTIDIKDNYFFYASSQFPPYKEYIQDILLFIERSGGILVPHFHSFVCHENKMLQELEKRRLNISSPKSYFVGTYEEGISYLKNAIFPMVGKRSKGFGGKSVVKINNFAQGQRFLKHNLSEGISLNFEYMKWLYKKIRFKKLYPKYHGKVILQEMVQGLDHDWKILVFGNQCYALKRFVKNNDFRASGSGKFDYDAVPSDNILNFALEVTRRLNLPFASLDIIEKNGQCILVEYQSVHFGLLTALQAKKLYEFNISQNIWHQKAVEQEVDTLFAEAIVNFIGND